MSNPKTFKNSGMEITLRKDFYDTFAEQLKKITSETEVSYIGHNIIKNYREPGHKISTFCNHEAWHDLYWDKYLHHDPMEKVVHETLRKSNFAVVSWEIGQNQSECGQERAKLLKVKDGVFFSFKRPDNFFETFIIGWDTLNTDKLDVDYILQLTSLLKPIRDHHWEVLNNG